MERYTFCFTGHRPGKLYGYDKTAEGNQKCIKLWRSRIVEILEEAKSNGYDGEFIFRDGMALGFDIWMAEEILDLRDNEGYNVKLYCDIPCKNQHIRWNQKDQLKYHRVLKRADKIKYVTDSEYTRDCMIKRDKHMVDNVDMVLALCNGSKSGTLTTINYALSKSKYVINLNPETFEFETKIALDYK